MLNAEITDKIIGVAIDIHRALGPGLLESAYREIMFRELLQAGFVVEKEKTMAIVYGGIRLNHAYRIDLLVDNKVVVELKAVEEFHRIHFQQVLTYLKLGDFRTGLLINFHVSRLVDGIKRISN